MNTRSAREQHEDWLTLVEPEGQFLTIPVLRQAFPSGLDPVPEPIRAEARERLAALGADAAPEQRRAWIEWLLRIALNWGDRLVDGASLPVYPVPEYRTHLRADAALTDPATRAPRVLVVHVPHGDSFERRGEHDAWNASPLERVELLARHLKTRLALLTDGERIALVYVPEEGHGGHGTWPTDLFAEGAERTLFSSFVSLLHARRFFDASPGEDPEGLFAGSALAQQDLTSKLGFQVRRAVELLVAACASADREARGKLLAGIPPHDVYEAAATVVMRLVFLLFAEERQLLPLADPLYARHYAISTLHDQLDAELSRVGEEPLERRCSAWRRILASSRAIFAGIKHERLRQRAYGGRLFNPARYPFLEHVGIDDLTVHAVLSALQVLDGRRLSFLALDVEQIGHVYEGLLDHDAVRVEEVHLGLIGKNGEEAEVPLADLEEIARSGQEQLVAHLSEVTGKTSNAVGKLLAKSERVASGEDVEARRLLITASESDMALVTRIAPFSTLLRSDLHGLPMVFPAAALIVKKTRARRDSGTEYTPRVLAEEMVRYALEPLVYSPGPIDDAPRDTWQVQPSADLLALRILDPACGSGAFLVAACRYLADRVVEAWERENHVTDDDATREAQRVVVERCLYGVDRDPMAVEMAKLSLWLLTFAKGRPFGFLDHAIREGDSLIGISSLSQLTSLHLDPMRGQSLHGPSLFNTTKAIEALIDEAARLRRELEDRPSLSIRDTEEKERLNVRAEASTATLRVIADALIGIELSLADRPDREREVALLELASTLKEILDPELTDEERAKCLNTVQRQAERQLNAGRPANAPQRSPLHWPLAFPEIFRRAEGGFDIIIGNPPFLGGQRITGAFGIDYRALLVRVLAEGRRGSADLVAYFFLRAAQMTHRFALLATDTIAQGDTREIGLNSLRSKGWIFVRAEKSRPWPGPAQLEIAEVWATSAPTRERCVLGGLAVSGISPLLLPVSHVVTDPKRLIANMNIAFQGSNVLGKGFTMSPQEAERLIMRNNSNSGALAPYINAKDICDSPSLSPSRWVINFQNWPQEKAENYSTLIDIVRKHVKPMRDLSKYTNQRLYWWRFERYRPALYAKIAGLNFVIAMPLVSKYAMPVRLPTGMVYSHKLAIFTSESYFLLGVLSAGIHQSWILRHTSTRGVGTNYSPTDCFENFALPTPSSFIADTMQRLDSLRRKTMLARSEGITDTYNRFHDPNITDVDVQNLRNLHIELDHAVLAAYGWNDLCLDHVFHETSDGMRYTIASPIRVEILDRLHELNQRRAAEEAAAGVSTNGKTPKSRRKKATGQEDQPSLLSEMSRHGSRDSDAL